MTANSRYEPLIHKVPYHVLIVYGSLFCSGALLSSRIVISTASCFIGWNSSMPAFVKLGSDNVMVLSQIIDVSKVIFHDYYQYQGNMSNDIALILLKKHVQFDQTKVKKVLLAPPQLQLYPSSLLIVSTWTKADAKTNYENYLVQYRMEIIPTDQCRYFTGRLHYKSNFCAQYRGYTSTRYRVPTTEVVRNRIPLLDREGLPHDSGSPAMTDGQLMVGLLSFVQYEDSTWNVGVFTNISYFYRWIMVNSQRLYTANCVTKKTRSKSKVYEIRII